MNILYLSIRVVKCSQKEMVISNNNRLNLSFNQLTNLDLIGNIKQQLDIIMLTTNKWNFQIIVGAIPTYDESLQATRTTSQHALEKINFLQKYPS